MKINQELSNLPEKDRNILAPILTVAFTAGEKLGDWLSNKIDNFFNVEH